MREIICPFSSKKNWQNFRVTIKLKATEPASHDDYCGGWSHLKIGKQKTQNKGFALMDRIHS